MTSVLGYMRNPTLHRLPSGIFGRITTSKMFRFW